MSSTSSPQAMIEIHQLSKRYRNTKVWALNEVSFNIDKGDFFGILGPNGSGKTTLLSILCHLLHASSGKANVHTQQQSLVPQEIALYPSLTLHENMRFFGRAHNIKTSMLKQNILWAADFVKLTPHLNKRIDTYSGGMKRRANIALSLLSKPQLLLLDEPTVNVDPQSRELIFKGLEQLNQDGTTIVYTTHYMEEAQRLCKRIAILDHGTLITQGTPNNLIAQHPKCHDLNELFLELTGREPR